MPRAVLTLILFGGLWSLVCAQVPDGFEVVDVVRHDDYKRFPAINNCREGDDTATRRPVLPPRVLSKNRERSGHRLR